jgi:hypothetical protein
MVRLTTCGDAFEARVLAARLGAEGIVWSLRGGHDGPFAIGAVDVLVDADDYESARELLISDLTWVEDHPVGPEAAPPYRPTTGRDVLIMVGVLVAVTVFAIVRMGMRV